jgi:hypothetical protein
MNYHEFEVQLMSGSFLPEGWSPGRVFAVPGDCSLARLGEAIDRSLGRWDLAHERDFTIKGKRIAAGPRSATLDSLDLAKDELFEYEFDLGDSWTHRCMVRNVASDLYEIWDGWKPAEPTAVEGWGDMPDQYGRSAWSDDGSVED